MQLSFSRASYKKVASVSEDATPACTGFVAVPTYQGALDSGAPARLPPVAEKFEICFGNRAVTEWIDIKMKPWIGLAAAVFLLCVTGGMAADFDGDGVADEFTLTRDAEKVTSNSTVRLANPWNKAGSSKKPPKGLGFIVRLSRTPQTYLLQDPDFFDTPIWKEGKPLVEVINRQDRRYREWKKQVPSLQADALQLGTEAGIDILLYWNGKRWQLFWPNEDP